MRADPRIQLKASFEMEVSWGSARNVREADESYGI